MANGLPGTSLSGGNRLSALLQDRQDYNNGTVTGGLAHVLQQYMNGRNVRQDGENQQGATDAYVRGMTAQPWTNPDTGEVAPAGSAGGQAGAMAALQGQQNNPYARNLAMQLMMEQAQTQAAEAQWQNRFDAQNQAQDARFDRKLAAEKEMALYKATHPDAPSTPSNVAEYQYYQKLTPEQQQQYLLMKRANPYLNLGDSYAMPNPTQPGQTIGAPINVGVAPEQKIDAANNRIITAPGIPSGPSAGLAASHGQALPQPVPQPPIDPNAQQPQPQGQGAPMMPQPANPATTAPSGPSVQELPPPKADMVKARVAIDQFSNNAKYIGDTVDLAISQASKGGTGVGSIWGNLPGTQANDLRNTLNTLKANIGFDKLQSMRENSPTGGALGNVSDTENKLLQSVNGALEPNQSREQLIANLSRIKDLYGKLALEKQSAFQMTFGGDGPTPTNGGWSIQKVQ